MNRKKTFVSVADTLQNIHARNVIKEIFPDEKEFEFVMQMYGLNRYQYLKDEAWNIDYRRFREFANDFDLDFTSYIDNPIFNLAYHLTYPGFESISDRWNKYGDVLTLSWIYVIDDQEFEPVVRLLVNMLTSQSDRLAEVFKTKGI